MANFQQDYLPEPESSPLTRFANEGGNTFLREGEFQSPNFRTGETGWKVTSEGDAEFRSINVKSIKDVFGGDGSDGSLEIRSGTTTINLANEKYTTRNYKNISITGTGKLAFSNPHSTGSFIFLKSQGDVILTSNTSENIDASGMGAAGGAGGTNADGSNGTTAFPLIDDNAHYGSPGTGGGGGAGGSQYGLNGLYTIESGRYNSLGLKLCAGSGGGGGRGSGGGTGGSGGRGGGALVIECAGILNVTGKISVEGAVGGNGSGANAGGGGGGSGGTCVVFYRSSVSTSGTISDAGGNGGSQGSAADNAGGGAGGIGGAGASGGSGSGAGGAGGGGAGSGSNGGAASTSANHYIQI